MKKLTMAVMAALAAFAGSGAVTTVDVADGTIYEFSLYSPANSENCIGASGYLLRLGSGCTVKLVDGGLDLCGGRRCAARLRPELPSLRGERHALLRARPVRRDADRQVMFRR